MPTLTLELAQHLTAAACAEARRIGVPMTIAVVDTGGRPVSLARMDGAPFMLTEIAIGKAVTAACFSRPSADVAALFDGRVQFTTSVQIATGGRFTLAEGGLPVIVDDQVVGGVAASGGQGSQDHSVVRAALDSRVSQ